MVAAKTENTDRIVAFVAVETRYAGAEVRGDYNITIALVTYEVHLLSGDFGDYTSIRTNANHWAKMDQAESTACVIR